jgi:hypothetical protein
MKLFHTVFVIAVLFIGITTHANGQAAQNQTENVAFRWGFGAFLAGGKFVPITKDTTLKTGEEMKMVVELVKECFVYMIYQSSKGEFALLFPYEISQFIGDYKTGKNYFIPAGRSWFKLDKNTGRETFYLLASSERLTELEILLGNYNSADPSQKPQIASDIVKEIRETRRKFKNYATLAERPVTIGGNVRGVGKVEEVKRPDVSTIATHISATNFYSKTFTIDHQ